MYPDYGDDSPGYKGVCAPGDYGISPENAEMKTENLIRCDYVRKRCVDMLEALK